MKNEMKLTNIYSLLCGIILLNQSQKTSSLEYFDEKWQEENIIEDLKDSELKESVTIDTTFIRQQTWMQEQAFQKEETEEIGLLRMDNDIVQVCLPQIENQSVFEMKVILYAPKVFWQFLKMEQVDLEKSFNLLLNAENIRQFQKSDGGKSGQFFYFSADNQIILKTMTNQELHSIRKRLLIINIVLFQLSYQELRFSDQQNFRDLHFLKDQYLVCENSHLNYEEYQFRVVLYSTINLIRIPKKYILRCFDLKGSEYDREVISKKGPNFDLSTATLKDLDFFKTEGKVQIDEERAYSIRLQIEKDAKFFRQMKLIDYSLLLLKVNLKSYLSENNLLEIQFFNEFGGAQIIPSIKEDGVKQNDQIQKIYYLMGIIDYLQEWNLNKGLEKTTKQIINLNTQLDTSAQNPEIYSQRFVDKLIQKIFC